MNSVLDRQPPEFLLAVGVGVGGAVGVGVGVGVAGHGGADGEAGADEQAGARAEGATGAGGARERHDLPPLATSRRAARFDSSTPLGISSSHCSGTVWT